jgi:hypothetical protein
MKTGRDRKRQDTLSADLRGRCREIAKELNERNGAVRDDKILTARVRICSGYYDSEDVLHTIADRLLSEGHARPPSS